jgi:uncharacterized membrane protein YcgQ (UPF0703/DUF1980 family)
MKISLLLVLTLLLFCPRYAVSEANPKVCSLKDRLFVQQVSDIHLNPQNYKNKIIQVEGFFGKYIDEKKAERYSVYRRTAGCCGYDGSVGFEFIYKNGKLSFKEDDWILVEAQIAKTTNDIYDYDYIYLEAISVVPKERGKAKEFVY